MDPKPKNPALRYYGGKFRMASWVISHFPPHVVYVEPFGGAAGVLLRKERSAIEVYNDLESEVFNFFQVVRDQRVELVRKLNWTPFSREEHAACYFPPSDPVERARAFFIKAWQSFGGPRERKTGWKKQRDIWTQNSRINHSREWIQSIRNLAVVGARFRGVQLEHRDALAVIADFDSPSTLFYCDPPYPSDTRNESWMKSAYKKEFSGLDHLNLVNMLRRVKGLVLLSSYPNELYRESFADWACVEKQVQTMNKTIATEQLYISPRAYELLGLPSAITNPQSSIVNHQ